MKIRLSPPTDFQTACNLMSRANFPFALCFAKVYEARLSSISTQFPGELSEIGFLKHSVPQGAFI